MVTHAVEAPALTGQTALGFLAALGLLHLLNDRHPETTRLSFSATRGTAVIHSPHPTLDAITKALVDTVAATAEDAVIAGADPGFPPHKGTGKDPIRPQRTSYRTLATRLSQVDPQATDRWLPHMSTDLAVDREGRAAITPFSAQRGQQGSRSYFEKSFSRVRKEPSLIREALSNWRRIKSVTGEYLDHRVLNSPVDDPRGTKAAERGVPGATWLATMALPFLRLTGDGQHVAATLWHKLGQRSIMIWPLWTQPLDPLAVQVLLEHPSLKPVGPGPAISSADWQRLGVFAVYAAEREKLPDADKFAGVLAPVKVTVVSPQ